MYKEKKILFKNDELEKYEDLVYELKKKTKSKRIGPMVIEALESKLRTLNAECDKEE